MAEALLAVKFPQEGRVVTKKNLERIQKTGEFL